MITSAPPVNLPPVPGNGGKVDVESINSAALVLHWTAATDDVTPSANLLYQVQRSGAVIKSYTVGLTELRVNGLKSSDNLQFTVTVKDAAGLISNYQDVEAHYGWFGN